jgi:hypothetical protein
MRHTVSVFAYGDLETLKIRIANEPACVRFGLPGNYWRVSTDATEPSRKRTVPDENVWLRY